jgi:hypothetical protein
VLFIQLIEYDWKDIEKVIEKFRQLTPEREKWTREGKIPKLVYGPYLFSGESKGFAVYETDDPDKLTKIAIFYEPEMTMKWVPLIEAAKLAELWLKMKK